MPSLSYTRQVITSLFVDEQRSQTRAEEVANSLSHVIGLTVALAAGGLLIVTAIRTGQTGFIVGASIYVATLVSLYLASTLYHGLPAGRMKSILLICDHAAIYVFIAGSYTPFALGVLRGPWGLALFITVWGLALAGVAFKVTFGAARYARLSTAVYVGMGWVLLLAVVPVWHLIPLAGLLWLLAGGIAYTAGVAFFRAERLPYAHLVWHLFVMAGTACHYIAVLRYAAGA